MKKFISLFMAFIFLTTCSVSTIYGATHVPLSDQQILEMTLAATEVAEKFSALGFTKEQIVEFLELDSKGSSYLGMNSSRYGYNGEGSSKAFEYYNNYYQVQKNNRASMYSSDWAAPLSTAEQASRTIYVANVAKSEYGHRTPIDQQKFACYLYLSHYIDNESYTISNPNFDNVHSKYICKNDVIIFDKFINAQKHANYFRHLNDFSGSILSTKDMGTAAYDLILGNAGSMSTALISGADALMSGQFAPEELGIVASDLMTAIKRNYNASTDVNNLAEMIYEEKQMYSETFQKFGINTLKDYLLNLFTAKSLADVFLSTAIGAVSLGFEMLNLTLDYASWMSLKLSFSQRVAERFMIELGLADHL